MINSNKGLSSGESGGMDLVVLRSRSHRTQKLNMNWRANKEELKMTEIPASVVKRMVCHLQHGEHSLGKEEMPAGQPCGVAGLYLEIQC